MRRVALALLLLVPLVVLAQGMTSFSGLAYCLCKYDCVDAGVGQRINAACVNATDGGVCYYPKASLCTNGACNIAVTFNTEGPCYRGPTIAGNGYATAMGCTASACYYNADGGTCSSGP